MPSPTRIAGLRRTHLALGFGLVLLVHLGLGLLARWPAARSPVGDELSYLDRAAAWEAVRESQADPPPVDLLWPPLYPRFLAAIERVAGALRPADRWHVAEAAGVQIALLWVAAGFCGAWGRRLGLSRERAGVAALFVACFPPLAAFAHYFWPEVPHLVFLFGALWFSGANPAAPSSAAHETRWKGMIWRAAGGATLGLALLTKSLLTPVVPLFLLALVIAEPAGRKLASGVVFTTALAMMVVPTLVSNHRETGRWVIADSGTFNLWVGLTEAERRNHRGSHVADEMERYLASSDDWTERDALLRRRIGETVAERGVVATLGRQLGRQPFRLFDKDSYLTDQLPGGALHGAWRGYDGTPPAVSNAVRAISYTLYAWLLTMAAFGLAFARPGRDPWRWLTLALVAFQIGLFVFLHTKTRYRVPLEPLLLLYALRAPGPKALAEALAGRGPEASRLSRPRVVAGAIVAIVLLVFAFGGSLVEAAAPAAKPW